MTCSPLVALYSHGPNSACMAFRNSLQVISATAITPNRPELWRLISLLIGRSTAVVIQFHHSRLTSRLEAHFLDVNLRELRVIHYVTPYRNAVVRLVVPMG